MSLKRDHTYNCLGSDARKRDRTKHKVTRCSLMGNAIQASMLVWFVGPPLQAWGYLDKVTTLKEVTRAGERAQRPEVHEGEALVRAMCRMQTHRRGEIRVDAGAKNLAQRPVLQGLDTGWWQWQVVVGCQWTLHSGPITALEGRGCLLALKWRFRHVVHLE